MKLDKYDNEVFSYASDILNSDGMMLEKNFIQHGTTSVFDHSYMVTKFCLFIVNKFNLNIDRKCLIRGSLLHDYFLYDWHENDKSHRLHGFYHAKIAADNAYRDFNISELEYDMILCHMFPMNLRFPKYKEGIILTISDKICACYEIFDNYYSCLKRFVYTNNLFFLQFDLFVICFSMIYF